MSARLFCICAAALAVSLVAPGDVGALRVRGCVDARAAMAAEAAAHAAAGLRAVKVTRVERAEVKRVPVAQGAGVDGWLRLAREVGWPESDLATLARIIRAESGGNPRAYNASSGCAGLLQLHPCWYAGRWSFDPFDPAKNLAYGLKVKQLSGWGAWVTY